MTQLFDRLKVRTGIRDLCAHMCRHTWGRTFVALGSGDVFDFQAEGGWSDLADGPPILKDAPGR